MTLTGRNVLVTGGAGFIGSHLAERVAAERPANLVVVDNLFLGTTANLSAARTAFPGLRFHRQDATDFDAMRTILVAEEIEVVFNLAVVPLPTSLVQPRWTVEVNVSIATVLAELLRLGHYTTLVHFSSSEVYGTAQYVPMDEAHPVEPTTPYAASKSAADAIVLAYHRTFGVDVSVVRPFNTYGPRQNNGGYAGVIPRVVTAALRGEKVVIYGDGQQTRDFSFVRDVANAAVLAYQDTSTRGRVVNVASGHETSVTALVGELLELVGTDVEVVHGPPRAGEVRRHLGGARLLTELTGWEPSLSMRDGLADTVAWYRGVPESEERRGC